MKEKGLKTENVTLSVPPFWKKKKLKESFVKMLKESISSDPVFTDDYGEYRTGVFLYSHAIVVVSKEDDLWSLEIHGNFTVTLHVIENIRYKYLPNDIVMATLLLPREQQLENNTVVLYQIPGEINQGALTVNDPRDESN